MFKILVASLVLLQLEYYAQACTVFGRNGRCTSINNCKTLLSALKSNHTLIREAERQCTNFSPTTFRLCCPFGSQTSQTTLTRNRGRQPPNCGTFRDDQDRIVGGVEAQAGAWPWMAGIGSHSSNKIIDCGGTLISDQHVLTAAHCIPSGSKPDFVRLGEYDLSTDDDTDGFIRVPRGTMKQINVERAIIHPQYRKNCIGPCNDIAILKLSERVRLNGRWIRHACIPTDLKSNVDRTLNELYQEVAGGWIAGWGRAQNSRRGKPSNTLMQARVALGDKDDQCDSEIGNPRQYPERNSILCAGACDRAGVCKDTCEGDSGGPLMMSNRFRTKWYVVGVTSIGPDPCGLRGRKGKYTNVNHYANWILRNI